MCADQNERPERLPRADRTPGSLKGPASAREVTVPSPVITNFKTTFHTKPQSGLWIPLASRDLRDLFWEVGMITFTCMRDFLSRRSIKVPFICIMCVSVCPKESLANGVPQERSRLGRVLSGVALRRSEGHRACLWSELGGLAPPACHSCLPSGLGKPTGYVVEQPSPARAAILITTTVQAPCASPSDTGSLSADASQRAFIPLPSPKPSESTFNS